MEMDIMLFDGYPQGLRKDLYTTIALYLNLGIIVSRKKMQVRERSFFVAKDSQKRSVFAYNHRVCALIFASLAKTCEKNAKKRTLPDHPLPNETIL